MATIACIYRAQPSVLASFLDAGQILRSDIIALMETARGGDGKVSVTCKPHNKISKISFHQPGELPGLIMRYTCTLAAGLHHGQQLWLARCKSRSVCHMQATAFFGVSKALL